MSTHDAIPHVVDFSALGQRPAGGAKEREMTAATAEERTAKGTSVRNLHGEAEAIRVMKKLWALTGYERG
jgi:hypothetical protein